MNWRAIRRQKRPNTSGGLVALRFVVILFIAGLGLLLLLALFAAGASFALYTTYAESLPSADEISRASVETFETTRLYDRTGQHVLYEFVPSDSDKGRRTWVELDEIPLYLRDATIASEDKTFYQNIGGVNWEGLARAARGVLTDDYAGGGSSITMQLIRNVIMTYEQRTEQSYVRKVREIVLSIELTRRFPGKEGRDQILEWYLNNVFYGYSAYGVEAAAQTYFGKHVSELSLAECAMLVPLGQSPALNPFDYPEEAKSRQEIVLDQLYLQGYIDADEAWAAKQEPIVIASPQNAPEAPHYVWYVRDRLIKEYGSDAVYGGGLQVITSIDLDVQAEAEKIAQDYVASISEQYKANNSAVVVIDNKTSEIVAMVGSLNYYDRNIDGQVNMATANRQPGSSFKPFTYATAFDQGYTAANMVMDVRTAFADPPNTLPYIPENYSRNYHGPVSLRRALACSYNIPAVAVMNWVGPNRVADTARAMGIESLSAGSYGLSLALGGTEVRLLDMTYAYSVFANNGVMLGVPKLEDEYEEGYRSLDPAVIRQVFDANGKELYRLVEPDKQTILRPQVAYLVTDILTDNAARAPAFGIDNVLTLPDRPVAAKTGTTNDYIDGWTMGYTPQYSVGVWVGRMEHDSSGQSQQGRMQNGAGVRVAGPIWNGVMAYLHEGLPVEEFQEPTGMVSAVVDGVSGKLPTEYSPYRVEELFINGTVPTEEDDIHVPFRIVKSSGKLATAYTPEDDVETVVYDLYPPEAEDWMRENDIPTPPTEFDNQYGPNLSNTDVAIVSPELFNVVSGTLAITGNANAGSQERYWLEYGEGLEPSAWAPIGGDHGERVSNGVLEMWNTGGLTGLYTIRLNVMDGGQLRQNSISVLVDNEPPQVVIELSDPYAISIKKLEDPFYEIQAEDRVYRQSEDEWINITVDAVDNTEMASVEFYMDGIPLGISTVAPYSLRWDYNLEPPQLTYDFNLAAPIEYVQEDGATVHEEVRNLENGQVFERTITRGEEVTRLQVTKLIGVIDEESGKVSDTLTFSYATPKAVATWQAGAESYSHTVFAIAYDAAGNQTATDAITVYVAPKDWEAPEKEKPAEEQQLTEAAN